MAAARCPVAAARRITLGMPMGAAPPILQRIAQVGRAPPELSLWGSFTPDRDTR